MSLKRSIYFLDTIYPLSKCTVLAKERPVVLSFYVKSIPILDQQDEINALKQEIIEFESKLSEAPAPQTIATLQDMQRKVDEFEHQARCKATLMSGYSQQWRAPNALKRYLGHLTFLAMPLDIEDSKQADFIASEYQITRIPCLCFITASGIVGRSQRYLLPNEFESWLDELLEEQGITL